MRKFLLLTIVAGLVLVTAGYGQISEGGVPRQVTGLKSARQLVKVMPPVDNLQLLFESQQEERSSPELKPFRFAHPFEVNFTPSADGQWQQSADGWWVWQLQIRSAGALSLNLLFERCHLPQQARLFLFTPGQQEILGAFTANTIQPSGIFSVSPLPGDELVVQYELPEQPASAPDFVITRVNHDFIGILKAEVRRPLGKIAGACNADINCQVGTPWRDVQNSVCRLMVEGKELCTGTLLNNTAQNKKPYVLTANHCIESSFKAQSTVFLFNYESPYCGALDGDVSNSISGSVLKAHLDSLDFSLVELSIPPPPSFRPYYAGWNRSEIPPDSAACIHHPQGDIKKIAVDYNPPVISNFQNGYLKQGFWRTLRWEFGTTEPGSSGGPYFNQDQQVIGTLTGGAATCGSPTNDYFERFGLAWDYKPDSARQLKYWLDPAKTNAAAISGKQFNQHENLCGAFTNLREGDQHQLLKLTKNNGAPAGYWTGTNSENITEFAEKFIVPGDEVLQGVSLGIGRIFLNSPTSASRLTINVYEKNLQTATRLHTQQKLVRDLAPDAMNYIAFDQKITPEDTFFVTVGIENMIAGDSIAFYQSVRTNKPGNTFLFKRNAGWYDFAKSNNSGYSGALAFELIACNIGNNSIDTPQVNQPLEVKLFPNPTSRKVTVSAAVDLRSDFITVYNLLGKAVNIPVNRLSTKKMEIDFTGKSPGMYIIRVNNGIKHFAGKINYIP